MLYKIAFPILSNDGAGNIVLKNILSFLIFTSLFLPSYSQKNIPCNEAWKIVQTVEKFHFQPRPVDDEYSALVFELFLEKLDPEKLFFTKDDIAKLGEYKLTIDDDINSQKCDFLDAVATLYKERQEFIFQMLDKLDKQALDLNEIDSLVIEETQPYRNEADMVKEWEKRIKLQMMSSYLAGFDSAQTSREINKEELEKIQGRMIARSQCRIQAKIDSDDKLKNHVRGIFMNAVAYAFDPHTMYFKPDTKDLFESMVSKESYSYGIEVYRNQAGKIEVYRIVPGSIAWNSNSIHEGDIIVSAKAPGGESRDFDCLSMGEIMRFMASSTHNHATFFIRKKNGQEISIDLHKEKLEVEENVISTYVLDGDRKVGYMNLPTFYSPIDGYSYLEKGCARDVATDLIKLKREGIEGLIFDLRNNGGGSMMEAVRLAGIFINYGAVTITSSRGEELATLRDRNRGTVFSKPLVIMVNAYSASASELFAAAIQDYNRGVVVGGKTYGKSSAQVIMTVDSYKKSPGSEFSYGLGSSAWLKVTTGAFFRVDGTTHQKEGIIPDVSLPTVYDETEIGEKAYRTSLDLEEVDKKTYYYPLKPLPLDELRNKSAQRIDTHDGFKALKTANQEREEKDESYKFPLDYQSFVKYYDEYLDVDKQETKPKANTQGPYIVNNPAYLIEIAEMTDPKKKINEEVIRGIRDDMYIQEAYQILTDLIDITNQ